MAQMPKKFGEVIPKKEINFHKDAEKVELEDVIGEELLIKDALIVDNFHTDYGVQSFALIFADLKGKEITTICSGQVVVDKIRFALEKNKLPLYGTIAKADGKRYYDIT